MEENYLITIKGTMEQRGDTDTVELMTRGSLVHKDGAYYIVYKETETTGYVWNGEPVDDFEPIKGIGKVYEQRLYSAGIRTYAALANTAPERILEIVQARSPIPPDVASWIAEAQALANAETAT